MEMNITQEEFNKIREEKDQLLVIDFHAEWCGPCKVLGPVISELADDYKDKAVIKKVNVDDEGELAKEFGIRSIPTILFFKNGEIVEKQVGQASKLQLEEMIENHL